MHPIVNVLLTLAIAASYLPQHHRIIKSQSSSGINPVFLLFSVASSYTNLCNIFILQFHLMQECPKISFISCVSQIGGFLQLALQLTMVFVTFALFIRFIDTCGENDFFTFDRLIQTFTLIITVPMFFIAIIGYHNGLESPNGLTLAEIYGFSSMMLSTFQFIPQIFTTLSQKQVGALSIATMSLQVPGSFAFAYALASAPSARISTWISYFIGGALQGILLITCLYIKHTQTQFMPVEDEGEEIEPIVTP